MTTMVTDPISKGTCLGNLWDSFNWQKIINELEQELKNDGIIDLNSAKKREQRGRLTKIILIVIRPVVWKWFNADLPKEE